MNKIMLGLVAFLFLSLSATAQLMEKKETFTRADSLRGMLTPLRTCYDINYYHLDVKVDIEKKSISGSNEFAFTATQDFTKLQFDLFKNLDVERVVYNGKELEFSREFNAVFVTFPQTVKKGKKEKFTVFYSGAPTIARRPPWDGGFIFTKDKSGNPWVSVACQGFGASSWWPTKDHQSDEVDSMLISVSVPQGLQDVSNGRLRSVEEGADGYAKFHWFVSKPINNYNVTVYIGKYAHWTDTFKGEKGDLSLDYWSLAEDSAKARPHWDIDVKPMLQCFEGWFGPYPFYEDGYKLVQAPHLGMEHQSAVAYGNQFKKGYLGSDLSRSGWGLKFDYITIHESGHEWFGNNITSKDIADMWVHEGFTTYSEVLFVECQSGKEAATDYVVGLRKNFSNDMPIIGTYDVNKEGSGDMYYKGANLIHTIRQMIGDDEKFRHILRGLGKTFYHKTVTTAEIENYIIKHSKLKLEKVFDQYLRHKQVPILEYKISDQKLSYRWVTDVKDFEMPVKVTLKDGEYRAIKANNNWQTVALTGSLETFKADPNYCIIVRKAE